MPDASWYPNAARPSPGSWLAAYLDRHDGQRDTFLCGLRVLSGAVAGETHRWRYRRSAIDALVLDGVHTLHHGSDVTLRLRVDAQLQWDRTGPRARTGFATVSAAVVGGALVGGAVVGGVAEGADGTVVRVLLALAPGELIRLGIRM